MNDTTTAVTTTSPVFTVPEGSIVVGHDGSGDSDTALAVAFDFAGKLGVDIVVVRSWSIDTAPHGALYNHGYVSSFDEVTETVRKMLIADTAEIGSRHPEVALHHRAALAQPAQLLTQLAAPALMLVVGPRGLGGFAGLLLGSVSSQCVQLATCPVLVVPTPKDHPHADHPHADHP
ncbi:universal stress protein [Glaciihabitans sp. GrIS 2.15]|uniref:universal stress protein n=1 Tax=Glaciihabitans sp. GrIS 2.15 TaxID=3071710 RepID=UPI002DFB206B|nr:nucleotide-binding universal stress UspA family protein [Glaciihabitans sp. GrIS 2.15]